MRERKERELKKEKREERRGKREEKGAASKSNFNGSCYPGCHSYNR